MISWGILSTAKIGIEHLIPAIIKAENSNVTAIASRVRERARSVANRFAIPKSYGSYEDLLADPNIDAVYIPLISSEHVTWSIRAADAGKHVLCEKPISLHAREIEDIIAARDRNNVLIAEAFMVTYHPQWHKVRSLLADGAIGRLRHVQSVFTYNNSDPKNMRNILAQGGGALPDIGGYPVVTTRFATGCEPIRTRAHVERDPATGTDTYAIWQADFGHFQQSAYVSTRMALRQEMSFHGDLGWLSLAAPFNPGLYDAGTINLHNKNHSQTTTYRFAAINQYQLQVEHFANALAGDAEKLFSLEDSVKTQKLIDAIYAAGDNGSWTEV